MAYSEKQSLGYVFVFIKECTSIWYLPKHGAVMNYHESSSTETK